HVVTIEIVDDQRVESAELFVVVLVRSSGATVVPPGRAAVTIIDDDALQSVHLTVGDARAVEGGRRVVVPLSLDQPAPERMTVTWATRTGSATAKKDFVAASGTVVFSRGQRTAYVVVKLVDDRRPEAEECFSVYVGHASPGVEIARSSGTVTIVDDDRRPARRS
ncbi:MAG: Calx-beta domain-containing protein, partial [Ilumatobacteraceae bacterium]